MLDHNEVSLLQVSALSANLGSLLYNWYINSHGNDTHLGDSTVLWGFWLFTPVAVSHQAPPSLDQDTGSDQPPPSSVPPGGLVLGVVPQREIDYPVNALDLWNSLSSGSPATVMDHNCRMLDVVKEARLVYLNSLLNLRAIGISWKIWIFWMIGTRLCVGTEPGPSCQ